MIRIEEVTEMYESPIHVYHADIQHKIEGEILTAVMKVGVTVDKDELLRALQYDRGQYDRGYADAKAEIVHCWECVNWDEEHCADSQGWCPKVVGYRCGSWFCAAGKRRIDGNTPL